MITPKDIEEKVFKNAKLGGFDKEDVNEFLDEIIIDLDRVLKENEELKAELIRERAKFEDVTNTETSLYDTLETAKSLMNDIAASAERRAEVLVKNAELDCDVMKKKAQVDIEKYSKEGNRLRSRVESFRNRYIEMLENELKRAQDISEEFLFEFETDFMPESEDDGLTTKTIVVDKIKDWLWKNLDIY